MFNLVALANSKMETPWLAWWHPVFPSQLDSECGDGDTVCTLYSEHITSALALSRSVDCPYSTYKGYPDCPVISPFATSRSSFPGAWTWDQADF